MSDAKKIQKNKWEWEFMRCMDGRKS